jgi:hypothetical protein
MRPDLSAVTALRSLRPTTQKVSGIERELAGYNSFYAGVFLVHCECTLMEIGASARRTPRARR